MIHAANASGVMVENGSLSGPASCGTSRGKPAGMGGEIEQGHAIEVAVHAWPEIGLPLGQRICEPHRSLGDEMGEHVAGERLGDRADTQDRVAVRCRAAGAGALAEAGDRHFAVAHGADHHRRHLGVDDEDLPGERDHLVEQCVGARAWARGQAYAEGRRCNGDPQHPEGSVMSHSAPSPLVDGGTMHNTRGRG